MNVRPRELSIFCLSGITALTGCTQTLNDRPSLGGSYISPSFLAQPDLDDEPRSQTNLLLSSSPRIRSAWTPTQYINPLDGVVHAQELVIHAPLNHDDAPRVYGRFPSTDDVLSLKGTPWIDDLFITIDELGRSFIGTPYAVGYLSFTGQLGSPVSSPRQPWKRTRSGGWSSGYPAPKEPTENTKP